MVALDRYLETWNSRDPVIWATSLHFPHVRPGSGAFEMSRTAEEYAAGVDFTRTLKTGWHHTEWVSREVLQVGPRKVHIAGSWQRYTADDRPLGTSAITYVLTSDNGRWGVQSRFAAGAGAVSPEERARITASAQAALAVFVQAWNGHDPNALAATIHYPYVRVADEQVDVWNTAASFLAGTEPGRQRTWYQIRFDNATAVQVTANGVNLTVALRRLGRDGRVLSTDEGVMLVVLRDGGWKVQARSMMGT